MVDFVFENPTKIIFGAGMQRQVGEEVARYAKKVMLHYGGGSIKASGLYDEIVDQLNRHHIEFVELGGVQPNPRLSLVRKGVELCRRENIEFILAVGGGSVIDSAKAIGLGVANDCDVWDFYLGKRPPEKMLPVGVVLTIPAAGSEASSGSVITNEDEPGSCKRSCFGLAMFPKFAILNPELAYTLPAFQTACGAADIMAHVMERYFTQTPHTDLSDRMCEAVLKTVVHNTRLALAQPDDYDARAELVWCGTLAQTNILGAGRVGDWSSHTIEHELSGIYDIAHGAGLSVVFPAWMNHVFRANVSRFVQFAVRVWDVDFPAADQERIALEGIACLKRFFREIGLPTALCEAGIGTERFREIAAQAVGDETIGGFKPLDRHSVMEILDSAK